MRSRKITKELRDLIVGRLLVHTFEDRYLTLVEERKLLAMKAYEDRYGKDLEMLNKVPAYFVPLGSSIMVYAEDSNQYEFSGRFSTGATLTKEPIKGVQYRIASSDKGHGQLSIKPTVKSRFYAKCTTHDRKVKALKEEVLAARKRAQVSIDACGTTKRLVDAWPEIEAFLPAATIKNEVAIKRADLNAQFKLPAKAA